MYFDGKTKFVDFSEYCKKCKHSETRETDLPCNDCLTEPVNEYSHKPVNFEEKEQKDGKEKRSFHE